MYKGQKLQTIVIIFVFCSILLTLFVAGVSINGVLTKIYGDKANAQLANAKEVVADKLRQIEQYINYNNHNISSNDIVVAVSHLVNRYEGKTSYSSLLFDNDKKKIAQELGERVDDSYSSYAALYNIDNKVVAFAYSDGKDVRTGISHRSKKGSRYKIKKNTGDWEISGLEGSLPGLINEQQSNVPITKDQTVYRLYHNKLVLLNKQPVVRIIPGGGREVLGHTVFSVVVDENYFSKLSDESVSRFSLVYNNESLSRNFNGDLKIESLTNNESLFDKSSIEDADNLQHELFYIHAYQIPVIDKNVFILIYQPKSDLASALNQTRKSLMIVFAVTALLAIIFGVFALNSMIVKPIKQLVYGAKVKSDGGFPVFPVRFISREISQLGKVLNSMVGELKQRSQELEKSEKQLRHSHKMARLGGWKLDHVHNELEWSEQTYEIFGVNPDLFQPSYAGFLEIIHPEDEEYVDNTFTDAVVNQKNFDAIYRILLDDGDTRFVRTFCETEYNESASPIQSIGVVQDITEQIVKDEQIRRTQKMDALDQLTCGIAHDFNNSLNIILGFSEILKLEAESKSTSTEYIEDIIQAGERAKKLTSKLMSFTRKDLSSPGMVNINQLLMDEYDMLQKTLTVRVKLKLELNDDLWPVWVDKNELEDSIINMSINSMHAMQDGGDLILNTRNISLEEVDVLNMDIDSGDYVLFSITDTGCGMGKETIQRVFEPFYSTKKENGTGLGMSQVYGFVKRSKGEIIISSEKELGTRIDIYLPRMSKKYTDLDYNNDSLSYEDLSGSGVILVVDDEQALRRLTTKILTDNGYEVFSAGNCKEAFSILEKHRVDMVLSDVILPGMNGYELAARIKKQYPQLRIQMMSGYAEEADNFPINDILRKHRLHKPFTSKALLYRVKNLLEQDERPDAWAS